MRLNAVPFLLLPGVALVAYLVGHWPGVAWATMGWCLLLAFATLVHHLAHRFDRRPHADARADPVAAPQPESP